MTDRFDTWLSDDGPVALVIRESLVAVTGKDGVIFPPTFAPDQESTDKKAGYVIDDGICLVDTVGSQSNRLEPIFKKEPYRKLVPQVTVAVGERTVNLLDAGHRAADAVVRFSDLWSELQAAFLDIREKGDSQRLAKIAPTSLVFGAWDSRDTQTKIPRLVESTIRAYGATPLRRSAQYTSSIEEDVRRELGIDAASLGDKDFPAEWGLVDNPSGRVHGGVVAREGIRREAVLNLVALRALSAGDAEATRKLQRYILGLSLIAFLAPATLYLRQGCLLTVDKKSPPRKLAVHRDGAEEDLPAAKKEIESFAAEAAAEFGVGPNRQATFDADAVKKKAKEKKTKK
ncbi:MAG: type I-U CRISPR-associated RAMP protein Csb1/Cas7u [Acidobacteriales bacterium]|nr:type I-U CRISPR-associated RAMP protein Csb1/Cas7u [Terriglobales bacterium]